MVATRSPSRNDSCLGIVLDTLLDEKYSRGAPVTAPGMTISATTFGRGPAQGQSAYNLAEAAANQVQGPTLARMRVKHLGRCGLAYS